MKQNSGVTLWEKAKSLIPGGNQLLSKRSEMFLPGQWPSYYKKARGAEVWDLDGNHYYDYSIMGIGTCVLGYAHPSVTRAVTRAVRDGSMSTLNCHEEVELAEKLVALHPWSGMARFTRTGGEACAVAVRIGRVFSGRDNVMFCGYHGWSDWYLSANLADSANLDGQLLPGLAPKGVPRALKDTAVPFSYGNIEEFNAKFEKHKADTGVIIMEVQRSKKIDVPFLKRVREAASQAGIVLIYDEVTSGFRLRAGGLHLDHGLEPDIVVLGKGMGNGHPIAAVVGKKSVLQAAQETFVSSTYWTERVGYAAALAVLDQFQNHGAAEKMIVNGVHLSHGLERLFKETDVGAELTGLVTVPIISFAGDKALLKKTVFTQEMLRRGFLASTVIYVSTAHEKKITDKYLKAAREVFRMIAQNEKAGELEKALEGPVCHSGFQRLA